MLLRLVEGEQVILRTRAHHRALIPAAVNLLVTIALMSFLLGYLTRDTQPEFVQQYSHIAVFLVWAAGLLSLGLGTLKPLIGWLNRFTFLTTDRLVEKNLVGAPQPTVIPLALLSQHQIKRTNMQEMAGAGDLVLIHGAYGQHQRTRLRDLPDPEGFNTLLAQELGEYRRRAQARAAAAQQAQFSAAARGDVHGASFGAGRV
ncbi:hypothetical protein [Nesterenkonia alkaliphila]|uniref:PH domain-containing protein n=1 Tax=Nesterenkonia alkaliphila TaxID=1463631 RepID=A0A7K1UJW3_9MICC|nr:hypothetical protein [Nesterenkonia alkaliphila]MVT26777.1 hypothetical protein [Nesterenkonia alkaliphila]GFZ77317.1 hypothetical protein GCM10011359_01870 [Nesterenkonia alkaliphila]